MNDKIVVCIQKGGQRDQAESFARRAGSVIADKPGKELTVLFDSKGVYLTGYGLTYQGDFENMLHRVTNGRLQHEMLVRAAKSEKEERKAIDATAGMGEDAFLLAAQGYEVTLYEQNPVVAVLLKDALRRAKKHPVKGYRRQDETCRGRQRRMHVQTVGPGRRDLSRSHVSGKTEIQPDQQETPAYPETGTAVLRRNRPLRCRDQSRPGQDHRQTPSEERIPRRKETFLYPQRQSHPLRLLYPVNGNVKLQKLLANFQ